MTEYENYQPGDNQEYEKQLKRDYIDKAFEGYKDEGVKQPGYCNAGPAVDEDYEDDVEVKADYGWLWPFVIIIPTLFFFLGFMAYQQGKEYGELQQHQEDEVIIAELSGRNEANTWPIQHGWTASCLLIDADTKTIRPYYEKKSCWPKPIVERQHEVRVWYWEKH